MGKRSEELEKHPSLFSDKWDEEKLLSACVALGAPTVSGWSMAEADLTAGLAPTDEGVEKEMLDAIQRGEDPLGDIFCSLRPPSVRRTLGATYTPLGIVRQMVSLSSSTAVPSRVVDPGCGSARFLVTAGRAFPDAKLIGFEVDPVAAVLARAHLRAAGLADRAEVILHDYRTASLQPILATYMARRAPGFVRNRAEARHLNIAHGLYPRIELSPELLDGLVRFLGGSATVADGRTYAGGLTKFEPREMERLLIPDPKVLLDYAQ